MALSLTGVTIGADGPRVPLVILHGLFGSAQNWRSMALRLAVDRTVHALDLRNHGASPWADAMDYPALADDVAAWCQARGVTRPVVLGHSMGGKTAMVLALRRPDLVSAVIVVDIAPVAYRHDHHGLVQALRALEIARITRRSEADQALAGSIPDPALRQFLLQNLVDGEGGLTWRLNLAAIADAMTDLTGFPPALQDLQWPGPALFLTGDRSDYVEPVHHDEIFQMFPAARLTVIPGAGHRVHADQPQFFASAVQDFLARLPPLPGGPAAPRP